MKSVTEEKKRDKLKKCNFGAQQALVDVSGCNHYYMYGDIMLLQNRPFGFRTRVFFSFECCVVDFHSLGIRTFCVTARPNRLRNSSRDSFTVARLPFLIFSIICMLLLTAYVRF